VCANQSLSTVLRKSCAFVPNGSALIFASISTTLALRHAAASLFIAYLGWTPKRLQAVMGQASIAMTFDRYGHLFADHDNDREAMKKLQAAVIAA